MSLRERLREIRSVFLKMSLLTGEQKNRALEKFAVLLEKNKDRLLRANAEDLREQKGKVSASVYQRLELSAGKIDVLAQGMRDLIRQQDPCGRVRLRRELDKGLILEQRTVPLGVIGVIFESRPDAVPQILSLVLKSGNAAVLKGGKEAIRSNRALMSVVEELNRECPFLPPGWAVPLETREETAEMLGLDGLIDLVIPRGSKELIQAVMAGTKIPVLGHADGICHIFVEKTAEPEEAIKIVVDAKTQYPAACNAVETLLVDGEIAEGFLPRLKTAAEKHAIALKGCPLTRKQLPRIAAVENWSVEYGEPVLAVKIVDGLAAAVAHINRYGSHHTDAILTRDQKLAERFCAEVDSASVMVNASTRFADGYRYGMGAEVGISTARTHARGPVGVDGLVTYKYVLSGSGQIVADYVGPGAKRFSHRDL